MIYSYTRRRFMKKTLIFLSMMIQLLICHTVFASFTSLAPPVDPPFVITGPYGEVRSTHIHHGVDIGVGSGTPVKAIADGQVVISKDDNSNNYGGQIGIFHDKENLCSFYADLRQRIVYEGQYVKKGQTIAYSGGDPANDPFSGNSTGPHLHFEIINGSDVYMTSFVDPGLYIPEIGMGEAGAVGYNPETAPVTLTVVEDFAKVLRDIINGVVDMITDGLKQVKGMVYKLFLILLTIDFAWAAIWKAWDTEESTLKWLIEKICIYAIFVLIISDWGSLVFDFALEGFPAIGSIAVGSNLEETGKLLSDPSAVIQKGLNVVATLVNEILSVNSFIDLLTLQCNALICGIFGLIFIVLFFIIGLQIAMAYLNFYSTVLLSFTGFMFSGLSYTRKYGANALNAVFVASLNLMFFCVFSFMLTNIMSTLSTDSFVTQTKKETSNVATGTIQSQEQLLAAMRKVESYGGNYHCDNGLGYYGAYQICKDYWDGWCDDYMANRGDGPSLDTDESYIRYNGGPGPNDTANEPTNTQWPWSPANQDSVARFITLGYYQKYGSWEAAGRAWNQGEGGMENQAAYEYQRALMGKGGYVIEKTVNYQVLLKLLFVVILFMYMADRLSNIFMKQFGQPGFKLGNEQGGLGS